MEQTLSNFTTSMSTLVDGSSKEKLNYASYTDEDPSPEPQDEDSPPDMSSRESLVWLNDKIPALYRL